MKKAGKWIFQVFVAVLILLLIPLVPYSVFFRGALVAEVSDAPRGLFRAISDAPGLSAEALSVAMGMHPRTDGILIPESSLTKTDDLGQLYLEYQHSSEGLTCHVKLYESNSFRSICESGGNYGAIGEIVYPIQTYFISGDRLCLFTSQYHAQPPKTLNCFSINISKLNSGFRRK